MENEIRTFVYRTGSVAALTRLAMRSLKRKLVTAFATLVVFVTAITSFLVISADLKQTKADEVKETEIITETAAIDDEIVAAAEQQAQNGTDTKRPLDEGAHIKTALNDFAENDAELMLLSMDGEETDGVFIPATDAETSANEETSEETEKDEREFSTRIEEIAEKVKVIEKPADSPEKLVYRYNPDMILDLDAENLEALERIVEAEACDQDFYGKMLVANVVINRVYAGFADTVKGVIFQKLGGSVQFAPIKDGNYYRVTVSKDTKEAVARVLAGEDYSQGATYFFQRSTTSEKKAAWFDNTLKYLFKYGTHEFYVEKRK